MEIEYFLKMYTAQVKVYLCDLAEAEEASTMPMAEIDIEALRPDVKQSLDEFRLLGLIPDGPLPPFLVTRDPKVGRRFLVLTTLITFVDRLLGEGGTMRNEASDPASVEESLLDMYRFSLKSLGPTHRATGLVGASCFLWAQSFGPAFSEPFLRKMDDAVRQHNG